MLVPAFIAWATVAAATAAANLLVAASWIAAAAPVLALVAAAAVLAAGFVWLYQNVDIVRESVNAVRDFILDKLLPAFQTLIGFAVNVIEVALLPLILQFKAIRAVITEVVIPAMQAIVGFVRDKVIPIFAAIITTIAAVATAVGEKVAEIVGFVTGITGKIAHVAATLFEPIKTAITGAKNWVSDRIDDVVGFATALPGRLAGLFSGMWDGIKNAFRAALNWVIDKWNGLDFTLPSVSFMGVTVGGGTVGMPDIPRLATGGVFAAPTVAMLGEYPGVRQNREVVSPIKLMADTFRDVLGASGNDRPIIINHVGQTVTPATISAGLAMARMSR